LFHFYFSFYFTCANSLTDSILVYRPGLQEGIIYLAAECRLASGDKVQREQRQVLKELRSFPRQKPTSSVYCCWPDCSFLQPIPKPKPCPLAFSNVHHC